MMFYALSHHHHHWKSAVDVLFFFGQRCHVMVVVVVSIKMKRHECLPIKRRNSPSFQSFTLPLCSREHFINCAMEVDVKLLDSAACTRGGGRTKWVAKSECVQVRLSKWVQFR